MPTLADVAGTLSLDITGYLSGLDQAKSALTQFQGAAAPASTTRLNLDATGFVAGGQQVNLISAQVTQVLQGMGVPVRQTQALMGEMQQAASAAAGSDGLGALAAGAAVAGTALLALAVGAAAKATTSFIDLADSVREASEMSGLSEGMVQGLGYALGTVGESADTGQRGLLIFQRNVQSMSDALANGTKPSAAFTDALARIGVSEEAIIKLSPDEQLRVMADAFNRAGPEVDKTATAMALFGRGGAELIPLLNQGSAALDAGTRQVSAYGASAEHAQATALEWHKTQTELTTMMEGFAVTVGGAALPKITDLLEKTLSLSGAGRRWVSDLADVITGQQQTTTETKSMAEAVDVATASIVKQRTAWEASGLSSTDISQKFAAQQKQAQQDYDLAAAAAEAYALKVAATYAPYAISTAALEKQDKTYKILTQTRDQDRASLEAITTTVGAYNQEQQTQAAQNAQGAASWGPVISAQDAAKLTAEAAAASEKGLSEALAEVLTHASSGAGLLTEQAQALATLDTQVKNAGKSTQEASAFQVEFAAAVAFSKQPLADQEAELQRLADLKRDGTPADKAYADAQLAIDSAVIKLGPDAAAAAVSADKLNAALGTTPQKSQDTLTTLGILDTAFKNGAIDATTYAQKLSDLFSKPTSDELRLRAAISANQSTMAAWNAQVAQTSPILQRIAALQAQLDTEQRTGASQTEIARTQAELTANIQADTSGLGPNIAARQQQIDTLQTTVSAQQAQLTSLQDTRQAAQDNATAQGTQALSMQQVLQQAQNLNGALPTTTGDANDLAKAAQGANGQFSTANGLLPTLKQNIQGVGNAAEIAAAQMNKMPAYGPAFADSSGNVPAGTLNLSGSGGRMPFSGSYPITQGYGPADAGVAGLEPGGFHQGIDYGVPSGTAISASMGGKVITAGQYGGYGNAVVIDIGNGLTELYGHLSSIATSVGQIVQQGQQIGLSGSTGVSTGPHLHFEVDLNGKPVDPTAYLSGTVNVTTPTNAGTLTIDQVEQLLRQAGASPTETVNLAAIAMAESRGATNAAGPQTPYGQPQGLFQFLPGTAAGLGLTNPNDPVAAARAALALERSSGYSPWETYTTGGPNSYTNYLPAAQAAYGGGPGGQLPVSAGDATNASGLTSAQQQAFNQQQQAARDANTALGDLTQGQTAYNKALAGTVDQQGPVTQATIDQAKQLRDGLLPNLTSTHQAYIDAANALAALAASGTATPDQLTAAQTALSSAQSDFRSAAQAVDTANATVASDTRQFHADQVASVNDLGSAIETALKAQAGQQLQTTRDRITADTQAAEDHVTALKAIYDQQKQAADDAIATQQQQAQDALQIQQRGQQEALAQQQRGDQEQLAQAQQGAQQLLQQQQTAEQQRLQDAQQAQQQALANANKAAVRALDAGLKGQDAAVTAQFAAQEAALEQQAGMTVSAQQASASPQAAAIRLQQEQELQAKVAAATGSAQQTLQNQLTQMRLEDLGQQEQAKHQQLQDEATAQKQALADQLQQQQDALKAQQQQQTDALKIQQQARSDALKAQQKQQSDALADTGKKQSDALADQQKRESQALTDHYADMKKQSDKHYDDLKKAADAWLVDTKRSLADELKAAQDTYNGETTSAALNAHARTLIESGHQADIVQLLNQFDPDWNTAGRTMGEQLVDGLEAVDIPGAVAGIFRKAGLPSATSGGVGGRPPTASTSSGGNIGGTVNVLAGAVQLTFNGATQTPGEITQAVQQALTEIVRRGAVLAGAGAA